MDKPLPVDAEGPNLWFVIWHKSGSTKYGHRGDSVGRYERSVAPPPEALRWEQNKFRYEAIHQGRVEEVLADGSVRLDTGKTITPDLFEWKRLSQTSAPPDAAPSATGPF